MKIRTVTVGPLEENCYIVWDDTSASRPGVVIDPGFDGPMILKAIAEEKVSISHILHTHGHFDHVGADLDVKRAHNPNICIRMEDASMLTVANEYSHLYGVNIPIQPGPDIVFKDDPWKLEVGSLKFEAIHTPGHTEGGVCYLLRDQKVLFSGDTLFAGGIGRTDLPGGNFDQIIKSIKGAIFTLGDDVVVYPGHGPDTTIRNEKMYNPFTGSTDAP